MTRRLLTGVATLRKLTKEACETFLRSAQLWTPARLRRHPLLLAILPVLVAGAARGAEPSIHLTDASAIISRSIAANEGDWLADPLYDRCEREDDGDDVQTRDVTMVRGRPYERLVAVDDQPISPSRARDERDKWQREIARHNTEDTNATNSYRGRHARFSALFQQFSNAFTFALEGRRRIAGRTGYHVIATPRSGYTPPTRDARALTGMTVEFWVDVETYHWIKLAARITKPVSVVGLLVRLEPGTTVELEKAPMHDGDVWLITHLRVQASSRVLMLFGHHTSDDLSYFNFRRSSSRTESACQDIPER